MIGTEDEVAERVKAFEDAGRRPADHLAGAAAPEERMHTVERMAYLVGAGTPA